MKTRLLNNRDFLSGLLFMFFGGVALKVGTTYSLGTAARMGPGYLPSILGALMILLGLVIAGRSLWASGEGVEASELRPVLLVIGAVVAFGLLVDSIGLVLTIPVLVVMSRLARPDFRPGEVFLLTCGLVLIALLIFVYALGLPFKIWPT